MSSATQAFAMYLEKPAQVLTPGVLVAFGLLEHEVRGKGRGISGIATRATPRDLSRF